MDGRAHSEVAEARSTGKRRTRWNTSIKAKAQTLYHQGLFQAGTGSSHPRPPSAGTCRLGTRSCVPAVEVALSLSLKALLWRAQLPGFLLPWRTGWASPRLVTEHTTDTPSPPSANMSVRFLYSLHKAEACQCPSSPCSFLLWTLYTLWCCNWSSGACWLYFLLAGFFD